MTEFKYPNSAMVETDSESTLVVGQKYDYKEGGIIGECEFIGDASTEDHYVMKFKWTIHPFVDSENGKEFICSEHRKEKFYYSGMVHILKPNTYTFPRRKSLNGYKFL